MPDNWIERRVKRRNNLSSGRKKIWEALRKQFDQTCVSYTRHFNVFELSATNDEDIFSVIKKLPAEHAKLIIAEELKIRLERNEIVSELGGRTGRSLKIDADEDHVFLTREGATGELTIDDASPLFL